MGKIEQIANKAESCDKTYAKKGLADGSREPLFSEPQEQAPISEEAVQKAVMMIVQELQKGFDKEIHFEQKLPERKHTNPKKESRVR